MKSLDKSWSLVLEIRSFPSLCIEEIQLLVSRGFFATALLSACGTGSTPNDSDPIDAGVDLGVHEAVPDINDVSTFPSHLNEDRRELVIDAELSGVVYDEGTATYYAVDDDGFVLQLDREGRRIKKFDMGGDLESIALDPLTDTFFVGDEDDNRVTSFVISDGKLVKLTNCKLGGIPVHGKDGFEGLTFVPIEYAPESWGEDPQGFLIGGSQATPELFVYPRSLCVEGDTVEPLDLGVGSLISTRDDVSGLHYDPNAGLLVIHDDGNRVVRLSLDGGVVDAYKLEPGGDYEGIFIIDVDCSSGTENGVATLVTADDGGRLTEWAGFPVDCGVVGPGVN